MSEDKSASGYNPPTDEQYATMVFEEDGDLVINLSEVQEMKFENVPKGTYVVEIDSTEYGMSQNSGAPMLTVDAKIAEGEYAGRKMRTFLSFSQRALPGTKATMMRISPELTTQAFKPNQLSAQGYWNGKKQRVRIDLRDGQDGEKRSQIVGWLGPVEGEGDGFGQQ